jgi:hypothetical protein
VIPGAGDPDRTAALPDVGFLAGQVGVEVLQYLGQFARQGAPDRPGPDRRGVG